MAVAHNLTVTYDNTSGFDPVAGETDGTTIGRSWLLWKTFEGLLAFNSNIKKITNAAPTPTFLQAHPGVNLQTEPAKNRGVAGDTIRFYLDDDPGLLLTPQAATIYEMASSITTNAGIIFRVYHKIDGSALQDSGSSMFPLGASTGNTSSFLFYPFTGTTTTMSNIPYVVFWKSANSQAVISISKATGLYLSSSIFFFPNVVAGYRHNVGAVTNALNAKLIVGVAPSANMAFFEVFTSTFLSAGTVTGPAGLNALSSSGSNPAALFTFNSTNNLIGNKLRFAMKSDGTVKFITEEIEGVLLVNQSAVSIDYGQIASYGGIYYLQQAVITDGREYHRLLIELGT
jgi:hypothetical protein